MSIKTGVYMDTKNIYIDYPFEEVMFRRMSINGSIHRKFYGEFESNELIHSNNKLYNDALLFGMEITKKIYLTGK